VKRHRANGWNRIFSLLEHGILEAFGDVAMLVTLLFEPGAPGTWRPTLNHGNALHVECIVWNLEADRRAFFSLSRGFDLGGSARGG